METIFSGLRYLYHKLFTRFHHLGWMVTFKNSIKIHGSSYIHLGNYVSLDSNCTLNAFTVHKGYAYTYKKPLIRIEDNVGISQGTFISALRSIQIKKNVMIGPYCFIGDYDHAYEDVRKPIVHQPLHNIRPVIIEEGAWLGAHVTVCSGVTIGKNSVVGAGSVVTKDIPSFSLAVGVPVKIIKKYNFKTEKWEQVKTK